MTDLRESRSAAVRWVRRNRAKSLGLLIAAAALGWTSSVVAFVPPAERTMSEIAKVNRASGRSKAIALEFTMRVGDSEPLASGELISHPSGLARLEIRGFRGRVDRYLLSGAELLGAKDGRRLANPQPLLQPFFLLQPSSQTTLRAALETFGMDSRWIGLAPCGEQDCFVIGDPRLAAPLANRPIALHQNEDVLTDPLEVLAEVIDSRDNRDTALKGALESARERAADPDKPSVDAGPVDDLDGPLLTLPESGMMPRLWVDTKELQVRRIDRSSGVFMILGPMVNFEKLIVPAWFEIHEPQTPTVRFEIDRAVAVNAPPQAFTLKWLLAPADSDDPTAP